jgi:hypothetical protein
MPDVATGAVVTPMEHFLQLVAQAVRGDTPSPTSVAGKDIDLSPRMQPPSRPGAPWRPQTRPPLLTPPPPSSGQLPRGRYPGLLEEAMFATQGALGLGTMDPNDYSTPEGRQSATRAGGTGELLSMLAPYLAGGLGMIKAYHGSPHDFGAVGERGAFKAPAIGTGEGGQAYSYGHYFAEHPSVATEYRDTLSEPAQGHMYEVNLHVEPHELLDWDTPVIEQPAILKKLEDAGLITRDDPKYPGRAEWSDALGGGWVENTGTGQDLYETLVGMHGPHGAGHHEGLASTQLQQAGVPGMKYLDQGSRWAPDERVYKSTMSDSWYIQNGPSTAFPSKAAAIKAAEQLSPRTRNIVMFPGTEHLIEILKKYGIVLPVAGAAYGSQNTEPPK